MKVVWFKCLEEHLFLDPTKAWLMSVERLQRRLILGLSLLWVELLGCLLPTVTVLLALGLMWRSQRVQRLGDSCVGSSSYQWD